MVVNIVSFLFDIFLTDGAAQKLFKPHEIKFSERISEPKSTSSLQLQYYLVSIT